MDTATLEHMNGRYLLPPGAGPAWRAAHAAGIDMSLIEASLQLTPEERLARHRQVVNFLLDIRQANESHGAE
jgi:hypothetical protein